MENISQGHGRVLRKRKIEQKPVQDKENTLSKISRYNLLNEHNYFYSSKKRSNRWPIKETTNDNISVGLVEDSTDTIPKNVNDYNEKCDSLPEWLKDYKCPSDIEDTEDIEFKSLSQILKIELDKDLLYENQNNKFECNLITFNGDQLDNEFHIEVINIINNLDDSLIEPVAKTKFIDCHSIFNDPKNSKDLTTETDSHFTNVETQNKTMRHIQLNNHTDIAVFNSNIIVNEHHDLSTEKKYFLYDVDSIETHTIANVIPRDPENVLPLFEWIDLIYLAVKNSAKEYLSCCEIQTFCRLWFPYYYKKSWIKDILSTITCYQEYFSCSYSIMANSCDVWTINNTFVNTLETKLKSTVKRYENEIKSGMKQPDQLYMLLNGYGVHNLGYNRK